MNVFAYGTLMFPEVWRCLAGALPQTEPAIIDHFARFEATIRTWCNFPYVTPRQGASVDGVLVHNITPEQLARLDWFEEEGEYYVRKTIHEIRVNGERRTLEVQLYEIGPGLGEQIDRFADEQDVSRTEKAWNPATFRDLHLAEYLQRVVVPAVCSEDFTNRFGGPGDREYVEQLLNGKSN